MALAVDSEMPSNAGLATKNNDTVTGSFTNTAGTYMLVGISWGNTNDWVPSAVSYNSVSMGSAIIQMRFDVHGGGTQTAGCALFGLLSPATGSNIISITMTGAPGTVNCSVEFGAITFTGNHATTPIKAGQTFSAFLEGAGGTTASVGATATTSGNIVVAQLGTGSGYSSTTNTLSWSNNNDTTTAGGCAAMTRAPGTGGTVTMSDTIVNDFWGIVAAEVQAAAGGGGTPTPAGDINPFDNVVMMQQWQSGLLSYRSSLQAFLERLRASRRRPVLRFT